MDKEEQDRKRFLEEQLEWCKKQDCILEEIEIKLHEMKKIAKFTLDHELTVNEIHQLNNLFNELQKEILFLEAHLYSIVQ